jgi:hypothetical protein
MDVYASDGAPRCAPRESTISSLLAAWLLDECASDGRRERAGPDVDGDTRRDRHLMHTGSIRAPLTELFSRRLQL